MILNYKTGKLPPNFIYLGYLLFGIGIWRMIVLDWKGILFFVISLLCLFITSGITIDSDKKRLKKYVAFFSFKKGEWESIQTVLYLQIAKTKEIQSMNVLSINRTVSNDVYKLFLVMPEKKIELMADEKELILKRAERIATSLETTLKN